MSAYSPSRLSTYQSCPFKYKLQYVDRIKRDTQGIEAFLGSRVHEVLEKLYTDLKFCKTNSLDDLLAYYESQWKKNWHDDIQITRQDYTADNYYQIGTRCTSSYYKRYHPFDKAVVIGIEKNLQGTLDKDGEYKVMGFADRIDQRPDGTYEIHDYKTSNYLPEQSQADEDRQLALYHLMLKSIWDDVNDVDLVWHYVAFDKEIRSSRDDDQLDELASQTIELIQEIEKAKEKEDWPTNESGLCKWCDYPDLCPKTKHSVQVEALPVNEYLKDDGVKLVNKYAKWYSIQKEAKDELEKIKEAVLDYAKREGFEAIKGSDHQLKVRFSTKLSFPGKSDKEREQLEQLLKEIGKWDDISTLDTHALIKVIQSGKWDASLLEKIAGYYIEGESSSVSFSKLKEEED